MSPARRIAYLSLQAVVDGQDTWAAVMEVVRGMEAGGWVVGTFFPSYPDGVAPGALARVAEMSRVMRRLDRDLGAYDAVYVRAHPLAGRVSRRAAKLAIPVVQECNGPYEDLFIAWPSTRIARPLFEHLQREQYRRASVIISVAEGLTKWLIEDTGNTRVVTNGNGANVDIFSPSVPKREGLPERYAVFFGMFPPWQGIGTLLEAVRTPEWPADLPIVFAGDGAMRPEVERAVREMPDRVTYVGQLPYLEVGQVVAHALVSFVPMVMSERETKFSPLKLYESMACGVAVVATDVVGISEVVRTCDCGILTPAGDARAIASATARLRDDEELARAMGRRGRRAAVEKYSWTIRANERMAIVEEAIRARERRESVGPGAGPGHVR